MNSSLRALWLGGLFTLCRRVLTSRSRFVLMFHGVANRRYDHVPRASQPAHTVEELRIALRWLDQKFGFLTPRSFFESDEPGVLLTFDDGFANNATNAVPVLQEFAAPAIFFVATRHVSQCRDWLPFSRYQAYLGWGSDADVPQSLAEDFLDGMSAEQLSRCADNPLITIASHTVNHPFLSRLAPHRVAEELSVSKAILEGHIGQAVEYVAYPTGDYSLQVIDAVRQAGYAAAFAVDPVGLGEPLFEIPRIGIYDAKPWYLAYKLSGLHRRPISGIPGSSV